MREIRFRFIGALFFIVLVLSLTLTKSGLGFFRTFPTQSDLYQVVISLVGLGILIFTSEASGYLFNTLFLYWWNVRGGFKLTRGGYSKEWNKLSYDMRHKIEEVYQHNSDNQQEEQHRRFDERWKGYSADVFLSYFWQQAPSSLTEWVSRRYTVFFTSRAALLGIVVAIILSGIFISVFGLGWTIANTIVLVFSVAVIIALWFNGQCARTEGWQMVDLWLCGILNPKMQQALSGMTHQLPQADHGKGHKI